MNYNDEVGSFGKYKFSQPDPGSLQILNPAWINEEYGAGPNVDPTYLQGQPFNLLTQLFQTGYVYRWVDWNRNGKFDWQMNAIRANVAWTTVYCGNLAQKKQQIFKETVLSNYKGSSPKLLRLGGRLYLFYTKKNGLVYYKYASIILAGQPNSEYGSCNPGGDQLGNSISCVNWSSEKSISGISNAIGLSASVFGSQIILAYTKTSSYLFSRSSSSISSNGEINWSAEIPLSNNHLAQKEPELVHMPVNSQLFNGASKVLGLFFLEKSTGFYRWFYKTSTASTWTFRGTLRTLPGTFLAGSISPSIITFPEVNDPSATTCGVFSSASGGFIRFYCYKKTNDRWEDLSQSSFASSFLSGSSAKLLSSKPSLIFHRPRSRLGFPIDNHDKGQLWLFYTYKSGDYDRIRVFISKNIDNSHPPRSFSSQNLLFDPKQNGPVSTSGLRLLPRGSFSAYEDLQMSTLKAAWFRSESLKEVIINGSIQWFREYKLEFLPLADGTFDAQLKTGNDFHIMERNICLGLHGTTYYDNAGNLIVQANANVFCGKKHESYWLY